MCLTPKVLGLLFSCASSGQFCLQFLNSEGFQQFFASLCGLFGSFFISFRFQKPKIINPTFKLCKPFGTGFTNLLWCLREVHAPEGFVNLLFVTRCGNSHHTCFTCTSVYYCVYTLIGSNYCTFGNYIFHTEIKIYKLNIFGSSHSLCMA